MSANLDRWFLTAEWHATFPAARAMLPHRAPLHALTSAYLDGRARGLAFRLAEQEAEIRAHAGRLRWLTLAQAARRDQAWYDADRPGYLRAAAEALEAFSARVRLSRG
jgi:hypothetical protein